MHIGLNTSDIYIRCSKSIYEQSAHHGGGRWGESPPLVNPLIEYPGVAQLASARGLGPWGREFESLHPDH